MEWGWCPNFEYTHSAEKARNTTLYDEKYDVRYTQRRQRTSVLETVLCDHQPEAFSSGIGDEQSRYSLIKLHKGRLENWELAQNGLIFRVVRVGIGDG